MSIIRDSGTNNITYGSLKNESSRHFLYSNLNLPIIVECIGITYPNPDYFVKRKRSDYFVVELVLEGEGTLIYNDVEYHLKPNMLYILKPDSKHVYYSDKNNPLKKIWINFFSDMFPDILRGLLIDDEVVFEDVDLYNHFSQLINISKISINNEDICYDVLEILLSVLIKLSRKKTLIKVHSDIVIKIKGLLDNAVFDFINVDIIAKKLHLSKSQIIREFKSNYGVTPYKYLLDKRFEMAETLLLHTDKTINEIASLLSFADQHYFSNSFKKHVGCTPTAYRKKGR